MEKFPVLKNPARIWSFGRLLRVSAVETDEAAHRWRRNWRDITVNDHKRDYASNPVDAQAYGGTTTL
jgi:hypothetical protein